MVFFMLCQIFHNFHLLSMTVAKTFCTTLALFLLLSACDSDSSPSLDELTIERITFNTNQKKTYEWEFSFIARGFDGTIIDSLFESATIVIEVNARPDSVPGIDRTIQADTYAPSDPANRYSIWYTQNDSQLVQVASRLPSEGWEGEFVALKNSNMPPFSLSFMKDNLIHPSNDDIVVRSTPRIVFEYPLDTGKGWVSFPDPFMFSRSVTKKEILSVPAGQFECLVIESSSTDVSLQTIEYITTEGLVKSVETQSGNYRDSQNNPAGTFIKEETVTLLNIED